jgi:hypothetical protein
VAATNTLTGPYAFPIGNSADVFSNWTDGGQVTQTFEMIISNDGTDSCVIDTLGYADGGAPLTQTDVVIISVSDPSGVRPGIAYPSLTQAQEENYYADGGGLPATAFGQVLYESGAAPSGWVSSAGTVTFSTDAITGEVDVDFEATLLDIATASTYPMSGNATPGPNCEVGVLAP